MNRASQAPAGASSERGQAMVVTAIAMAALLGIGALAVDLGYLYVTRNELQNVADGAALAGARMLGHIYQGIPYQSQAGFSCGTGCVDSITGVAQSVGLQNHAGGAVTTILASDVAIGQWDGDNFTPTLDEPDAVQVITRRDEVANGPVGVFFARTLGVFTSSVNAIATASLTGQGTVNPGEVELPIGISRYFFDRNPGGFCNEDIQFYPTNDPASCAGWTSWDLGSSDNNLRSILEGDYTSPEIIAGQTELNFTGGTLSNPTFDALLTLFEEKGFDTDVKPDQNFLTVGENGPYVNLADPSPATYWALDGNGTPYGPTQAVPLTVDGVRQLYPDGTERNLHRWDTTVPVYDRDDCSNPNQSIKIVGFAQIELTDVLNAPDKLVRGKVQCKLKDRDNSRGGGGPYGIKASIPGLVR